MLDPTSLSFDTFQQRPTMLNDVGSIWQGLYGSMKRYRKYSVNSKLKKKNLARLNNDFKKLMPTWNKDSRI